jgi:serine/threonine protein kinase
MPLPSYIEEVVLIIQQVAQALDYAHRNNVIHRDIKPSNIMFGADNNAVLVDFGVAKLMDATSEFTAEGVLVGTYYYMAPENWESATISPAVDQYALGIILYQILAGRLPFEDTSLGKLMRQHSEEMPPPIHTIREGVPREINKVINRALAKKPDERFPTVSDFAQDFAEKAQPLLRTRQFFNTTDQTETTPLPQARSSMASQAHIDTNIVPQQAHRPIATLTVERSGDKEKVGKTFRINQLPYEIGRGKTPHELNFDADRNVSRLHAKITYDSDKGFLIQDLESTHGTTLNDKLIAPKVPTPLRNNTKIVLGKTTVLLFHTIDPEDTDYDRT